MRLTILLLLISVSVVGQRGLGEYLANTYTAGYWRLNGNSTDLSANANNGTDANITYGTTYGRFGSGASFSGTTAYITFGSQVIPLGAKTVNCWVKTSHTASTQILFDNCRTLTANNGTTITIDNTTGYVEFYTMKGTSGTSRFYMISTIGVSNGNWHMITCTWDGTTNANGAKLYIDGVLNNQATAVATESTNATDNLRIGALSNNGTLYELNGSLDEVIIESRAWSAQEIRSHYTQCKGRFVNN